MLRLLLFGLALSVAQEAEQKTEQKEAKPEDNDANSENTTQPTAETEKAPQAPKRPKMLVLYEKRNLNITHSVWIQNIQRAGDVVLKSAADPNLRLDKYGVNLYHTVFVMAPSVEHFGGNVTEQSKLVLLWPEFLFLAFAEFVDRGGNLFVTTDSTIGPAIADLGTTFGIEYDEPGRKIISHLQEDTTMDFNQDHSAFVTKSGLSFMKELLPVYGDNKYFSMPWANAIAIHIPTDHEHALPLVKCNEHCYT